MNLNPQLKKIYNILYLFGPILRLNFICISIIILKKATLVLWFRHVVFCTFLGGRGDFHCFLNFNDIHTNFWCCSHLRVISIFGLFLSMMMYSCSWLSSFLRLPSPFRLSSFLGSSYILRSSSYFGWFSFHFSFYYVLTSILLGQCLRVGQPH